MNKSRALRLSFVFFLSHLHVLDCFRVLTGSGMMKYLWKDGYVSLSTFPVRLVDVHVYFIRNTTSTKQDCSFCKVHTDMERYAF